ncbi:MAG TPA: 30S ribosomal protein S8 [Myxococcota bacterium]|jgi:small subunit ribosomal protein S8|nr:30S ribosomal protein S8 [Myxococcota bacterium]
MVSDPIGDMLTRIRNAGQARHKEVRCASSKLRLAVAKVLQQEGFLGDVRLEEKEGKAGLVLEVRFRDDGRALIDGLRRVSRPGRRVYVGSDEVPKVRNGLGVAVLSTPKGVMSGRSAQESSVGGELLCEVW